MQTTELYQLTQWVESEIVDLEILEKLTTLHSILSSNSRRQNNQPAESFDEEKQDLIEKLGKIQLNLLSLEQITTLENLGIKNNISQYGINKINKVLVNTLDIAHVALEIEEMINEVQEGLNKLTLLENSLAPFIIDGLDAEISEDQVLTRVIFEDDASVTNIEELKTWSSKWFDIGRGFAIANGQTPKDIEVIGGARGSLIIELAVLATTALPIAKAISMTLESMVKYKEFQLKAIEVRRLKDETPKLAKDFEDDAKRWEARAKQLKKEISDDISNDVIQYFSNYQKDNTAEYKKAVKTLVDFISKGGDVDCVVTDASEDSEIAAETIETMRQLREDFAEIRALKETLLLEHKDTE